LKNNFPYFIVPNKENLENYFLIKLIFPQPNTTFGLYLLETYGLGLAKPIVGLWKLHDFLT